MLVHEFDDLMEARPFQPFRIYTADGRSVTVKSPEFAWHPPAHRTIWVAEGEERVHMIDLHLVTRFEIDVNGSSGRRRRPRK